MIIDTVFRAWTDGSLDANDLIPDDQPIKRCYALELFLPSPVPRPVAQRPSALPSARRDASAPSGRRPAAGARAAAQRRSRPAFSLPASYPPSRARRVGRSEGRGMCLACTGRKQRTSLLL